GAWTGLLLRSGLGRSRMPRTGLRVVHAGLLRPGLRRPRTARTGLLRTCLLSWAGLLSQA
ncbi:MAG TPA: hypothetical protein VFI00_16705, partial [Kribbella sp.]|nr:hypothetical protein [Kribbella sp.]